MALHDDIERQREQAIADGKDPVPATLQGVDKRRIADTLGKIDRNHADIVDAVYALLDDQQPSWFPQAPASLRFCHGASTAHIACHVGILQRGRGKLDREGRDNWLKPLWSIGAMEKVYYHKIESRFLEGHPVAKSPNSAYRLADSFAQILKTPDNAKRAARLAEWISENAVRQRLEQQAEAAERARKLVDRKHAALIAATIDDYVPRFLPGYRVLYVDETDGDRISDEDVRKLAEAGIELTLGDAMPDVLLWNPDSDRLWVIEAVTSDGEVDTHKVAQLTDLAARCGKAGIDFTTAYLDWKKVGQRQSAQKNIVPNSFIWIAEEPAKQLRVLAE